jgi:hypothetical protein
LNPVKNQFLGFFSALRLSWIQLSKVYPLDWRFFAWFPAIHLMSSVAYDETRLGVQFAILAPAVALAELVFLVSYFGGYWVLRKLDRNAYGATGILVILVGGAQVIRGLALEAGFVQLIQISDAVDYRRLPGDFTLGFLVALVLAYLQTAQAQFRLDSAEIERVRQELEKRRLQARGAAAEAEQALRKRAQDALLTKLAEVEKLLVRTDVAQSAERVRQLVELEVRPLSKEIWNRLDVLADSAQRAQPGSVGLWPKTTPLKRAFRPGLIFLFANLNIIATANALAGPEFALTLLIFSMSMLPLGIVLRRLIPDSFEPKFWNGFLFSLALTGISLAPTWGYLFSVAETYPGAVGLRQTGAGLIILVVFGLGLRAAFATSQERLLQGLAELNDELSRELSVIEQAIWIAKRNWSFIVHGTVQGALTVAHTRLKQAGQGGPEVLKLVKGDIEKARQALERGIVKRQTAGAEFEDLITTWDGVCVIAIEYPEEDFEQIDETSRICSIEIVKEIVGNAFRHGQATKIDFKIEIVKDRIQIQATNNGSPVTESTIGLGTDLLNELTESWSIANESEGVVVRARIPFRST